MWRFLLPTVLLAGPAYGVTYEMGPVTVAPPAAIKVASKLVATQILEIEALGEARIVEPRLEFDQDIGFGLEVWPNMVEHSYIAYWICGRLGYGAPRSMVGTRRLAAPWVLSHLGDPTNPRALGLRVLKAEVTEVPQTLVCELKKS